MVGRSKPATVSEKKRMSLIKEQAWCIPCILNWTPNRPETTIQHVVEGGKRLGHDQSYGCCGWHHLGIQPETMTRHEAQHFFGPSLAHGKRPFEVIWGSERNLVILQDLLLENWTRSPWQQYNLPRHVSYDIRKRCDELRGLR